MFHLTEIIFKDTKWVFYFLYYLGIGLLIITVLIVRPVNFGREQARHSLSEYQKKGCEAEIWADCITIKSVNNPDIELYKGYAVTSSSKYIALFDGNKVEVIPRLEDYIISRTYTKDSKTPVKTSQQKATL